MSETTQEERALLREYANPATKLGWAIHHGVNDADRLAAIERDVKWLELKWRKEARQNFGRGTEYHHGIGILKERMASELRAILLRLFVEPEE